MIKDEPPKGGKNNIAGLAFNQLRAKTLLHLFDLNGQCGLAYVRHFGGAAKIPLFRQCFEIRHLTKRNIHKNF